MYGSRTRNAFLSGSGERMGFVDLFRRDDSRDSEIKTISTLEKWMSEVPLMDFAKSAVMINDSLSRLASSSFEGQALLDRLLMYFESIKQLSELAYERFTDESSGRFEVRRADFFFIRDMHLNYGQLYYDLVFPKSSNKLNKQSIQKAAVYAHASYAYALLRTYQLVVFVPKGVWSKVYQLYVELQARSKENAGSMSVKGGFPLGSWPLSGFYAAVLLPTTNPNQSEAFELEEAFHFICDNANEGMFSKKNHEGAQFCFSLARDKAPDLKCHYLGKDPADIFIDISHLYTLLATSKQVLSLGLEKKLTKIWDFQGERQIERMEEQGIVEVLETLSSVHAHFCEGEIPDAKVSVSHTPGQYEKNAEESAILKYYNTQFVVEKSSGQTDGKFMQWQLSNVSQSGACLINPSSDPLERLSVGELLALRGIEKNQMITAVVRWLSLREGRGVLMGLEYIAKENQAVYVQNETQKKNGFKYKAILASSTYPAWPSAVLVTPILSYHAQEKVFLITGENQEQEVMLIECVERTSNAIFFKIKI
jgi:hypothetical protein